MKIWMLCVVAAFSLRAETLPVDLSNLTLHVGESARAGLAPKGGTARWSSGDSKIAEVLPEGWVIGLAEGATTANERLQSGNFETFPVVNVHVVRQPLVELSTIKQYPDNREFNADGRKCFGCELNGQRASAPNEREFTRANRIVNPKPLRPDRPLDWEVKTDAEIFDGAGVLIGTVPPTLDSGGRKVPVSMFNFGASKVINGRICVYAFSVRVKPSAAVASLVEASELKDGNVSTSAWLPLDDVVDKEGLLERDALGKSRLPALPLESNWRRITGGNPKQYLIATGEYAIVKHATKGSYPVPSHYLRRPSGTVNLIYSVPGFGLGGEGTDSLLITDNLQFYPAKGVRTFKQPMYYPPKDPRAGQTATPTMTFIYGAVKCKGSEPVYGWIAEEALAPAVD